MTPAGRSVVFGSIAAAVLAVGVLAVSDGETDPAPAAAGAPAPVPEERVRVEVLNGGGVTGMARSATGVLREHGLDVVDFGNADAFDASRPSVVLDRVGRPEFARAVADVLGIDNVRSEPDPNLYVDVSVWLGSEWRPAGAGLGVVEDPARGPWWDPTGWLSR